jgi:hypothetical protein
MEEEKEMNTAKVTVSIPKVDLEKLSEYEKELKLTRSGVFKEAVELWLEVVERQKVEKLYKKVYENKKVIKKDKEIASSLLPLAIEIWQGLSQNNPDFLESQD